MVSRTRTVSVVSVLALVLTVILPLAALAATATGTFTDDNSNLHEVNIEVIAVPGITNGCGGAKYCPGQAVTRAEMASFLARMLQLPATSLDFFSDDTGNLHEANINRSAAASITNGCAFGLYCPNDSVTRAQMASFLTRALKLPAATKDYFTDDNGNFHEANINSVAAAGITLGCNASGTMYCPDAPVLRDQMASFLARSLKTGVMGHTTVAITAPTNLATLITAWNGSAYVATVNLKATATSPTASPVTVIWSSSVEGLLGMGASLTTTLNIPPGSDTSQPIITATAVDKNGAISEASIQLKLAVPSPG